MVTIDELNAKMTYGDVRQKFEDPAVIFEIASRGKTYVEIGTRFGGSAIAAGLAGCEVHCIDHFEYPNKQPDDQSTPEMVMRNWENAGIDLDKLHIYQQRHPPWPQAIEDQKFDIGMIDGTHTEEACRLDWEAMRARINGYILFHDIRGDTGNNTSPGIVFANAAEDAEWEVVELPFKSLFGILKRCEYSL